MTKLRKLTAKEESFCQWFMKIKIVSEAYRKAYDTKGNRRTVQKSAAAISKRPHVAARIIDLMEAQTERTKITADYVENRLTDIDQMDVLDILNENGSIKKICDWPKTWRTYISGMDVIEMGNDSGLSILKKIKWPDKVANLKLLGQCVNVQAFKAKLDVDIGVKKSLHELLIEAAKDEPA